MNKNKTTGLVLSGGGAKGAFQAGALQVLKEKGYHFEIISGVSVGTLNGAMLATDQFDTLIRVWENLSTEDVLREQSLFSIARKYLAFKIGLGKAPLSKFNNEPLRQLLREHLFGQKVTIPFYFGFVKLETGEYVQAVIQQNDDHTIDDMDLKRVLASTAIPVIFNPVLQGDSVWVDGGLRNISPIKEVLPYNPDRIIIIPTQPLEDSRKPADVKDIINIAFQAINTMLDEIFEEDIDRFLCINNLVKQAEKENITLRKSNGNPYKYIEPIIIAPEKSLGDALNFDNANLNNLLRLGRRRAEEVLDR